MSLVRRLSKIGSSITKRLSRESSRSNSSFHDNDNSQIEEPAVAAAEEDLDSTIEQIFLSTSRRSSVERRHSITKHNLYGGNVSGDDGTESVTTTSVTARGSSVGAVNRALIDISESEVSSFRNLNDYAVTSDAPVARMSDIAEGFEHLGLITKEQEPIFGSYFDKTAFRWGVADSEDDPVGGNSVRTVASNFSIEDEYSNEVKVDSSNPLLYDEKLQPVSLNDGLFRRPSESRVKGLSVSEAKAHHKNSRSKVQGLSYSDSGTFSARKSSGVKVTHLSSSTNSDTSSICSFSSRGSGHRVKGLSSSAIRRRSSSSSYRRHQHALADVSSASAAAYEAMREDFFRSESLSMASPPTVSSEQEVRSIQRNSFKSCSHHSLPPGYIRRSRQSHDFSRQEIGVKPQSLIGKSTEEKSQRISSVMAELLVESDTSDSRSRLSDRQQESSK